MLGHAGLLGKGILTSPGALCINKGPTRKPIRAGPELKRRSGVAGHLIAQLSASINPLPLEALVTGDSVARGRLTTAHQ